MVQEANKVTFLEPDVSLVVITRDPRCFSMAAIWRARCIGLDLNQGDRNIPLSSNSMGPISSK